jgi:hypothetical protein
MDPLIRLIRTAFSTFSWFYFSYFLAPIFLGFILGYVTAWSSRVIVNWFAFLSVFYIIGIAGSQISFDAGIRKRPIGLALTLFLFSFTFWVEMGTFFFIKTGKYQYLDPRVQYQVLLNDFDQSAYPNPPSTHRKRLEPIWSLFYGNFSLGFVLVVLVYVCFRSPTFCKHCGQRCNEFGAISISTSSNFHRLVNALEAGNPSCISSIIQSSNTISRLEFPRVDIIYSKCEHCPNSSYVEVRLRDGYWELLEGKELLPPTTTTVDQISSSKG